VVVWCCGKDEDADLLVVGSLVRSSMMNAGAGLLLLKTEWSLLECLRAYRLAYFESKSSFVFIWIVLHVYLLDCLRAEGFNYCLLLLPGQLFSIIVLATVVSLYIPFALSSDRRYLQVIFWISLPRPND
jgi:hypothetical protein